MKQKYSGPVDDVVLRLIRAALGSLWVEVAPRDSPADLIIRLANGDEIAVQVKHLESPVALGRQADRTVYVLRRATRRLHDEFRSSGRSFVDVSGTVHLALPNLLVDRTNLRVPAVRGAVRHSFDPFSDRGSLVARTLVASTSAERTWGIRELAAEAGVSPATTTRVVRELERHGVQVQRSGRNAAVRLVDPRALFSAWTRAYDWTRNPGVSFHAPMGDPTLFLARMRREWNGPRWAITLQAGASQVAPHASWDRVHIYVDAERAGDVLDIGESQGWGAGSDGRVVLMKPYYRAAVWRDLQLPNGLPVVSNLQLALDLWHYPLRGREQAEHLLEMVPPWRSV